MGLFLAKLSLVIADTISWFSSTNGSKPLPDNQEFQGDSENDLSSEPLITNLQEYSHVIAIHGEDEHPVPNATEQFTQSFQEIDIPVVKDVVEEKTSAITIPDSGAAKEGDKKQKNKGALEKMNSIKQVQEEVKREGIWIRDYCSSHKILLVGEGDFSFSVCLAKAFGSATNMVATSLDSQAFLEENYPSAKTHIGYLKKRGCTVMHEIDATKMAKNNDVNDIIYDRIIFNFPLAGFFSESKKIQLKRNRHLVRQFFLNAKDLIACDGEVHIRHKSSSFYREWDLENLAKQTGFKLIEDGEFKLSHYRGYNNKYGFGGNENFNCYPCRVYKFVLKPRNQEF